MQLLNKAINNLSGTEHSKISDTLSEKFQALFPVWTTVLSTILAVLIILLILTKLVYNPVKKMHDDRKEYIQSNIDSAELQQNNAFNDREKANDELVQARLKAIDIIHQAKQEAKEVRVQRIEMAEIDARKIVQDAKNDMQFQQEKFEEESKEAIINIALEAASKVVEKEVNDKTNRKIIEDFIKETK